jgi:hypothetical protein
MEIPQEYQKYQISQFLKHIEFYEVLNEQIKKIIKGTQR